MANGFLKSMEVSWVQKRRFKATKLRTYFDHFRSAVGHTVSLHSAAVRKMKVTKRKANSTMGSCDITRSTKVDKLRVVFLLCGIVLLSSCASVQLTSTDMDTSAKGFEPASGKANLYIARGKEITGGAYSPQILVDGINIGTVGYNTYLLVSVAPGHHNIMAISQWGTMHEQIEVNADSNHFVKFSWQFGLLSFGMSLKQLDEDTGKAMVKEGKRAQSTQDRTNSSRWLI